MEKISVGGIANATGFEIFDFTNKIYLKTKDYRDTNLIKLYKLWCKTRVKYKKSLVRHCLFWLPQLVLKLFYDAAGKRNDIKLSEQTFEWHSCEHRLIWLIKNKKEITLETLRKAPDCGPRCGSGKWQVLYLRFPAPEKLEETLRVGREYYKKLEPEA